MSLVTCQLLCASPALLFPEQEGGEERARESDRETERGEEEAMLQMMNPPLDCIISG